MRLTIDEYCKHFKMSKEMLNSKLRAKKLNYIIENGQTYIIVTRSSLDKEKRVEIHEEKKAQNIAKPKTTVAAVLALYQKENTYLKEKIMQLEMKVDKLIDDKEKMLINERNKIEEIYSSKDAQLKNILELVNAKMNMQREEIQKIENFDEHQDAEIISKTQPVELKAYLKSLGLNSSKRKIIKKRFLNAYDSDSRIILQNGKLFLDFSAYDYSDLFE